LATRRSEFDVTDRVNTTDAFAVEQEVTRKIERKVAQGFDLTAPAPPKQENDSPRGGGRPGGQGNRQPRQQGRPQGSQAPRSEGDRSGPPKRRRRR